MKTLLELQKEESQFFKHNNMPTEFDKEINDIQREKIKWAEENWAEVWAGNINKKNNDGTLLCRYLGGFVHNFEYDFIIPFFNQKLYDLIDTYRNDPFSTSETPGATIRKAFKLIEGADGIMLLWV